MKRIRILNAYGQHLVAGMQRKDRVEIRFYKEKLLDISAFTRGLVQQIVDENSKQDIFLYDKFDAGQAKYFNRLNKFVSSQYSTIASSVSARARQIYLFYRSELKGTLRRAKFDVSTKELAEAHGLNVTFGGTATQSFSRHLRNQLQAGRDPAALITTLSQDHVRLIQRQMGTALAKGKGFGWTRDKVANQLMTRSADAAIRKEMEYNITRIARTSYMQAANLDTTGFVAENRDAFIGSRRVADGRPCIACIAQDGKFYPPGSILEDHPNGMCVLVPIPYPDEYLKTGILTQPVFDKFGPSLGQQFYSLSVAEQRSQFANDKLYRLWQTERFDLEKVVVGKFGTPISYRQAALNLDVMGGISAPRVNFFNPAGKKVLNGVLDPKDRHLSGYTVTRKKPKGGISDKRIDLTGDGSEYYKSGLNIVEKTKIAALYGDGDLSWLVFNQRARALGIYTRKDVGGRFYYIIPDKNVKSQLGVFRKSAGKSKPVVYRSQQVNVEYSAGKEISMVDNAAAGRNNSWVVRKEVDGTENKYLLKKTNIVEAQAEQMWSDLADEMGHKLVPATYNKPIPGSALNSGVVQEWVSGKGWNTGSEHFGKLLLDSDNVIKFIKTTDDGQRWFLMDYIFGQADRHGSNVMFRVEAGSIRGVRLIDNGLSLVDDGWFTGGLRLAAEQKFVISKTVQNELKVFLKRYGWTEKNPNWKLVSKNIQSRFNAHTDMDYFFNNTLIGKLKYLFENEFKITDSAFLVL